MAFDPPDGILDIGNATLRVGKLEVAETSGLNQGLQNIVKNDLLVTENNESSPYTTNQKWGLKLPTTWVAEFELKGHSGKYIDFNFYNENSASNAQGYNLTFMDTTMTLRYDGGSALGGGAATIPTIVGAYRKVNIFFERGVISVSIDGTRYLYHKESDGFNQGLGVASRVVSATGSAFVNLFIEQNAANSAFKNLRIVNGRFISDKTSNIAFIGGNLGVGVNSPKEALDIRGNMHLTRVSNVSQISVDSNVVTEYTGPHDRPMRKYPEVALTANDNSSTSGYIASTSTTPTVNLGDAYLAFDGDNTTMYHTNYPTVTYNSDGTYGANSGASKITDVDNVDHDGEWLKIQLPKAIKVEYMKFQARVSYSNRFPNKLSILGSNDNSNWYLLLRDDNVPLIPANPTFHTIQINATTKYKYYVLVIRELSHSGAPSTTAQVSGWELYGHEEGSGSLDTTLKTVYNVPATTGTQLEVYYDGQDYSGVTSTVTDKVGTTTNATISNSGSTITFDSTYKAWTFGGDTTRTDTFISAALPSSFVDDQSHSVSLWFNPSYIPPVTSSFGAIFSIALATGEANNQNIQIQLNGSDTFSYVFWNNDEGFDVPMGKSIVKGQWYHLSATYEPSTGTRNIFLNGEKCVSNGVGGANPGADLDIQSGSVIKLGARQGSPPGRQEYFGSIANFRLYSKALNAGQVQELYDYQKDYFLGSKSQVTLYKGHLGVGVTEPSGQLELAGDERIQEYPPRALTGYETYMEGHGVFTAYSSENGNTGFENWNAFDKVNDPGWTVAGNFTSGDYTGSSYLGDYKGEYLVLKLPYAIKLKSIGVFPRGSLTDRYPSDYTIVGSNDGNVWSSLKSFSGLTYTDTHQIINSDITYSYFGMVVTKLNQSSTGDRIILGEWKLFGTPGPTTLDKGSLTLGRSLDVPRISRYDVDTETPRPEKLVLDFDTTVNSSPTDISGQGNHGTFKGTAQYSAAEKAFFFDGNSDYIQGTLNLNGSELDGSYTLSTWVKRLSTSASNDESFLFYIGEDGTGDSIGFYSDSETSYKLFHYNATTAYATSQPSILNTYRHIVATYDGTYRRIYIDGVMIDVTNTGVSAPLGIPNNPIFSLGMRYTNLGDNMEYLHGYMSNPKIYSVALEPSEVKKLYKLGRTGRSMVISDTAVGIGKVPEAQLDVRGNMNVDGVITTPQRPVFYAYYSGAAATANGYTGMIGFPNTRINVGNCFNTSDYKFYAPITGYYWFEFQLLAREGTGTGHMTTSLFKNGTNVSSRAFAYTMMIGSSDHDNLCFSVPVQMNAGDNIYPGIVACDTTVNAYFGEELAHFSGYFIG